MEAKGRATDKILASAVSVMGLKDPEQVTLDEIAIRANLSRGLIIYHFGSLAGLTKVVHEYLYFRLEQVWLLKPGSLLQACLDWAMLMSEEPDLFRLYLSLSNRLGEDSHRLIAFRTAMNRKIREYVYELQFPLPAATATAFCAWWEGASMQSLVEEDPGKAFRDRTRAYLSWMVRISS